VNLPLRLGVFCICCLCHQRAPPVSHLRHPNGHRYRSNDPLPSHQSVPLGYAISVRMGKRCFAGFWEGRGLPKKASTP
jgi:hypothetical protein